MTLNWTIKACHHPALARLLSFFIAEVFSWQGTVAREQPPVWQALWTLAFCSTQGCRSLDEGTPTAPKELTDTMKMLFILVILCSGKQAQSLGVFKGIFN